MLVYTAEANTPDWVLGKGHKSFPEIKYLVGVGVSEKSPIMATQSARTELIKTISIRINSVVTDYNSREKSISKSSIVSITNLFVLAAAVYYFLDHVKTVSFVLLFFKSGQRKIV